MKLRKMIPETKQINIMEKDIDDIISQAMKCIDESPPGSLRLSKSHGTVQYYKKDDDIGSRYSYICNDSMELVYQLAQKDYALKIIRAAEEAKKELNQFSSADPVTTLKNVYSSMSQNKKNIVSPFIMTDEMFISKWMNEKQESIDEFWDSDPKASPLDRIRSHKCSSDSYDSYHQSNLFITEQGEIVRSKSEKIIADKLSLLHIPYFYEVPLNLRGYGFIRPDFTVLNPFTLQEYYWEHLGLMSDPQYCEKAISKIETFASNGIFPGCGLILTFESKDHPLSTSFVSSVISEFLQKNTPPSAAGYSPF